MNYYSLQFLRRHQCGMSLIDILLVFALISLLAGLSTPSISKFLNAYRLRIAASDLSSFMHKSKIVAAKNNIGITIDFYPKDFEGYKVEDSSGRIILAVSFNDCEHPTIIFDKCYEGNILYEHPIPGNENRPDILQIKPNGLSRRGYAYITNKKKSKYYRVGIASAAGIVEAQRWNGTEWE